MTKRNINYILNYTHFGEIIQGVFSSVSKNRCAISMPIYIGRGKKSVKKNFDDNFKLANIKCHVEYKKNSKNLKFAPKKYKKSLKLLNIILLKYKKKLKGNIQIKNKIPISKGLGSSTVNMVGVAKILKLKLNLKLSNDEILKLCSQIEPTDPILKKDITLFSTIEGKVKKKFKFKFPKLVIFGFDTKPGTIGINTIKMGQPKYNKSEISFFNKSIKKLLSLKYYDKNTINLISKESLKINQKHVPKKYLNYLFNIEKKMSNDFIIGAHSGTMLGFAYDYNKLLKTKINKFDLMVLNRISRLYKAPIKKYIYV